MVSFSNKAGSGNRKGGAWLRSAGSGEAHGVRVNLRRWWEQAYWNRECNATIKVSCSLICSLKLASRYCFPWTVVSGLYLNDLCPWTKAPGARVWGKRQGHCVKRMVQKGRTSSVDCVWSIKWNKPSVTITTFNLADCYYNAGISSWQEGALLCRGNYFTYATPLTPDRVFLSVKSTIAFGCLKIAKL